MTGRETARLISALERELPSRRNDVLTEQERAERILVWSVALKNIGYMETMKNLHDTLLSMQWFPRLPELMAALNAKNPNSLDRMAERDAEYRHMFPGWVNDGLNYGQRIRRMEQAKLEEAERMMLGNGI